MSLISLIRLVVPRCIIKTPGHTIIDIPIVYFIKMAHIASISVVDGSVTLTGKASVGVLDSLLGWVELQLLDFLGVCLLRLIWSELCSGQQRYTSIIKNRVL